MQTILTTNYNHWKSCITITDIWEWHISDRKRSFNWHYTCILSSTWNGMVASVLFWPSPPPYNLILTVRLYVLVINLLIVRDMEKESIERLMETIECVTFILPCGSNRWPKLNSAIKLLANLNLQIAFQLLEYWGLTENRDQYFDPFLVFCSVAPASDWNRTSPLFTTYQKLRVNF